MNSSRRASRLRSSHIDSPIDDQGPGDEAREATDEQPGQQVAGRARRRARRAPRAARGSAARRRRGAAAGAGPAPCARTRRPGGRRGGPGAARRGGPSRARAAPRARRRRRAGPRRRPWRRRASRRSAAARWSPSSHDRLALGRLELVGRLLGVDRAARARRARAGGRRRRRAAGSAPTSPVTLRSAAIGSASKRMIVARRKSSRSREDTAAISVIRRVPSAPRSSWTIDVDRGVDLVAQRRRRAARPRSSRRGSAGARSRPRRELACTVASEPSWPVFIAWSMSSVSPPRTSPTTMRSGRMRSELRTRSRMVTWPLPSTFGGRDSSRITCSCWSWSSAESSMVTMRSSRRDEAPTAR